MPERLEYEVLQKERYIIALTFTFYLLPLMSTSKHQLAVISHFNNYVLH